MDASEVDWETINEQLPYDHSDESHAKRREIWNGMNVNGNKYLSLAEVDKGIRDVIFFPNKCFDCFLFLYFCRFWDWKKYLMPKELFLKLSDLPKTHPRQKVNMEKIC